MGEKKAWYLGAMFKAGQFNYKLSETGKQGDLMGGGITAGYQLRLSKALDLDFNLGLGYLHVDASSSIPGISTSLSATISSFSDTA